ncbi:glycosyltransferase family 2 protein [Xanthobacteraceae bacterium A53D]
MGRKLIRLHQIRLPVPASPADLRCGVRDFYILTPAFAVPNPMLRRNLTKALAARPDADLLVGWSGLPLAPAPAALPMPSILSLAANPFVSLPLVVRGATLAALGGLKPELGIGAAYELCLRAISCGMVAVQLPFRFSWPAIRPGLPEETHRAILDTWNAAAGHPWRISDGAQPGTAQLRRRFTDPPRVSVIVEPAPDGERRLAPLLDSLVAGSWPLERLDVVADPRLDTSGAAASPLRWRVAGLSTMEKSACRNTLWQAAGAEHLIFLDAGMRPQTDDLVDALAGLIADPNIGMVSGRVLMGGRDQTDPAAAAFGFEPASWEGLVHREFAVPVSPLAATRRSELEAVSGFDPDLPRPLQMADAALRMRVLGLSVVVTPFARVERAEGVQTPANMEVFLARWGAVRAADRRQFPV